MPKTWEPGRRGVRDLTRHIAQHGEGTTVYTVSRQALNMAPWEDGKMWSSHTFDWRSPITGHWMAEHLSVEGLLNGFGTVYEQPPRGMRELGSPGRQVAGPVSNIDDYARLDEAELRGLGKRVRDGSNPINRPRRGGAGWRS